MWDNDGKPHIDKAYRLSMTAKLDRSDETIKRIEERATSFPFYKRFGDFMPIVVQNYGISGQYRDHYDWFDDAHAVGGNIASTFFVYIHANCTGGGQILRDSIRRMMRVGVSLLIATGRSMKELPSNRFSEMPYTGRIFTTMMRDIK